MSNVAIRYMAHNLGRTAGLGGLIGGGLGVAREAASGKEQKDYLSAALRGGVGGAALGAAAGGIAGAANDVRLLSPGLRGGKETAIATLKHLGEGVSNFGRRQVHGLTGHGAGDAAYLDRIGIMGAGTSARQAALTKLRAADHAALTPSKAPKILDTAISRSKQIMGEGAVNQRVRDANLTNLPGVARGMVMNPRESAKALWDHARQGGTTGLALGLGVPAAIGAADIAKGDETSSGGRSVRSKLLQHGANIGTGFAFAGLPVMSQMVTGMGVDHLTNARQRRSTLPAPAQIT